MGQHQTLESIWEAEILPDMDEVASATLAEYRSCLRLWAALSGNPLPESISREVVKEFRIKLIKTPYRRGQQKKVAHRSTATVNRIMRDLHTIISPLWPADRVNPGGLGVVPFFKWPRSLDHQQKLPFVFYPADLDALYLNANACAQPSKYAHRSTPMNDPRLWRLALVLALNSAARTWDLFDVDRDDVRLDEEAPFEFGSLVFVAEKTGKLHRIPLNRCAAKHCEDILRRPVRGTESSTKLFPGFSKGQAFYKTWRRITAAAGVSGTFESMRKTGVTRHNNVIWNVGFWLSGHISPGVFGNYDNPNERVFEAVYKLENPSEFVKGMQALTGA